MNEQKKIQIQPIGTEDSKVKEYVSTFAYGTPQKKDSVKIVMPISVGALSEHCSGEQFRGQLKLINETFTGDSTVTFVMSSGLQQYTNQLCRMDEETAYKVAIQSGQEWKEENEKIIKEELTNLKYFFKDWSEYTHVENEGILEVSSLFTDSLKKVEEKIKVESEEFKHTLSAEALSFYMNKYRDPRVKVIDDPTAGKELCMKHFKEECAVVNLMKIENYDYMLYPGPAKILLKKLFEEELESTIYWPLKNKLKSNSNSPRREKAKSGSPPKVKHSIDRMMFGNGKRKHSDPNTTNSGVFLVVVENLGLAKQMISECNGDTTSAKIVFHYLDVLIDRTVNFVKQSAAVESNYGGALINHK